MLLRTQKQKEKHDSALRSDKLTIVMYHSCGGGAAILKRRPINMMGDNWHDRSRLVWAKKYWLEKTQELFLSAQT